MIDQDSERDIDGLLEEVVARPDPITLTRSEAEWLLMRARQRVDGFHVACRLLEN